MARRESTSAARPRRNGMNAHRRTRKSAFEQAVEVERAHLSQAESVLVCLHAALLYSDHHDRRDLDFAGAAGLALSLVRKAADSIDSARLQKLALQEGGSGSGASSRPTRPGEGVK